MEERYHSFNRYLRDMFGERVHRISIDAGFSCPNIDGFLSNTGCVYCNNPAFSHFAHSKKDVHTQIEESIVFYGKKMNVKKFVAYFQAFSNTHADTDTLRRTYDIIKEFPQIVGLAISTRPDCINEEKIAMIAEYTKDYLVWMEYGLQTTHNRILEAINRKHNYEDFLRALEITRKHDISVGAHMIVGLPGQSKDDIFIDAQRLGGLSIDGIKFHVLHVLKDTVLADWYKNGDIRLLKRDEYVDIICDYLERLPKETVILRLVSTANKEYLIGPDWINDRNSVMNAIHEELKRRDTYQGIKYESTYHSCS